MSKSTCIRPARRAIFSWSVCPTLQSGRAASGSSPLIINSGFRYPNKGITINLAPANLRKEGAGFDLPMALGILGATGATPLVDQYLLVGELSLDGSIRPVRGALSVAVCARNSGIPNLVLPFDNAAE